MDPTAPRFAYPVALDLHGVPVLVVGGGPIGARKAAGLADAGALVRLVAIRVSEHVDRDGVSEVRERSFEPDVDLDGIRLVVTATGDEATDRAVADAARERSIWVNAADQPADCGFVLPAIARAGRVTITVGTDGASPALAQALRDRAAGLLSDRVAALAEELAAERAAVRSAGGSTEAIDWRPRIEAALDDVTAAVRTG